MQLVQQAVILYSFTCRKSGIMEMLKRKVRENALAGASKVFRQACDYLEKEEEKEERGKEMRMKWFFWCPECGSMAYKWAGKFHCSHCNKSFTRKEVVNENRNKVIR